jgi:Protein of unknown function (DUF4058)/Protein of unknown function (DUF2934)
MQSPFPGMDPYLEDPALWSDFHRRLVACLRRTLLRTGLDYRNEIAMSQRRYLEDQLGAEDVLEIREPNGGRLVTLVDVVSPANKTTEAGRSAYLETRRQAREAGANLVEIDLVLQGQATLNYSREGLPKWHYAVTVVRATQPERFEIYSNALPKRLPRFRVPLAQDARDTVLDLQGAFGDCFVEGGFFSRIDYRREPSVPLGEEDRLWLDTTLKAQGLRAATPSHEEIARAAYRLWEEEGRPQGRDQEHWNKALARLRSEGRPESRNE